MNETSSGETSKKKMMEKDEETWKRPERKRTQEKRNWSDSKGDRKHRREK